MNYMSFNDWNDYSKWLSKYIQELNSPKYYVYSSNSTNTKESNLRYITNNMIVADFTSELKELEKQIDKALETGDKEEFIRLSKRYNYLKTESV